MIKIEYSSCSKLFDILNRSHNRLRQSPITMDGVVNSVNGVPPGNKNV
jgi:hypothetical protein